jgi:chemotaxis protein MotB
VARRKAKQSANDGGSGAPAWVMTFADLMSLLMCFFVLLLSFSEMDVAKYKEVAGSMKFAFGVQRDIKVMERPKGVSIIAKEYTPGKPQPTLQKVLRQQTTDENREYIEILDPPNDGGQDGKGRKGKKGGEQGQDGKQGQTVEQILAELEADEARKAEERAAAVEQARKLHLALAQEMEDGLLDVEALDEGVLIKVREQGSFPSGAADLNDAFKPVLEKIAATIADDRSRLVVSGHTDDIPISTGRYPSNWALSAARATSVVHALARRGLIPWERMEVRAHAETVPVAPNATAQGRSRNRRVEIFIGTPPARSPEMPAGALPALIEEHT